MTADRSSPLVSIVIPCFNGARFLSDAVESVFGQTYSNWELLLVDDGSVDGSDEIARSYADRATNVRYLEHSGHQNRGMSASRNLGIRHSTGPYVAVLDADDAWFPSILEEQVAILQSHERVAMVYGPIQWWYSWTGDPSDLDRDYVESLGVQADSIVEPPKLIPLFLLNRAAVPSGILIRREVVDRVGGFAEEFRAEYEDQVFCAKVCLRFPVYASGHCWYRYRQHEGSWIAQSQRAGRSRATRVAFLKWLSTYVKDEGERHPELIWALRHERLRWEHPRAWRWISRSERLRGLISGTVRV